MGLLRAGLFMRLALLLLQTGHWLWLALLLLNAVRVGRRISETTTIGLILRLAMRRLRLLALLVVGGLCARARRELDEDAAGSGALAEDAVGNGPLNEDVGGLVESVEAVGESAPMAGLSCDSLGLLIPSASSSHLSHVSQPNLVRCRSALSRTNLAAPLLSASHHGVGVASSVWSINSY